jgi:translation initiation factor IF-1
LWKKGKRENLGEGRSGESRRNRDRGGGNFVVKLENGHTLTAKLGGAMRRFRIRVISGDRVTIGVSPYDPTHGLILYRHKN